MRFIEARYEEGLLKPEAPLALTPGERVGLIVVRHPDPRRWNLERLAKIGTEEDRGLLKRGSPNGLTRLTKRTIVETWRGVVGRPWPLPPAGHRILRCALKSSKKSGKPLRSISRSHP